MACSEIGQPPARDKRVTISAGDDWALRMAFTEGEPAAPVDLTGWAFDARLEKSGEADVVLAVTIDTGAGTVTATLTDTQSAAMAAGSGLSDLAGRWVLNVVGTDSAGFRRRYLNFPFHVLA